MLSWNHHSECKRKRVVWSLRSSHLHTMCVFCLCVVVIDVAFNMWPLLLLFLCCLSISRCISIVWSLHRSEFVALARHKHRALTLWLRMVFVVVCCCCQHNTSRKWSKSKKIWADNWKSRGRERRKDESQVCCLNATNTVSVAYASDIKCTSLFNTKGTRSFFSWVCLQQIEHTLLSFIFCCAEQTWCVVCT